MRVGEVVGNYRITGKLGAGGMGAVYLARHTLIGREAAIKVLLPELCSNETIVARFFNEARTTTAIRHPGIVEIYDFGYAADGAAYLVMERLEGETLGARLKRLGRLPVEQALSIARQVTGALHAAHRLGIVHRDLKPDNIFIVPDPEVPGGERAKILDFGIAKLRDKGEGWSAVETQEGTVMGAPTYMAPEQFEGAEKVDQRADQYSVGCILFEMLCGRPPFEGKAYGEVMSQQLRKPAPRPTSIEPSIPAPVEELVLKLLSKRPEHRYRDAFEILQRLHQLSNLPPPKSASSPVVVPPPPPTRDEVGSPFESVQGADPVDGPEKMNTSGVMSSARRTLALGPKKRPAATSAPPPIPLAAKKPPTKPPPTEDVASTVPIPKTKPPLALRPPEEQKPAPPVLPPLPQPKVPAVGPSMPTQAMTSPPRRPPVRTAPDQAESMNLSLPRSVVAQMEPPSPAAVDALSDKSMPIEVIAAMEPPIPEPLSGKNDRSMPIEVIAAMEPPPPQAFGSSGRTVAPPAGGPGPNGPHGPGASGPHGPNGPHAQPALHAPPIVYASPSAPTLYGPALAAPAGGMGPGQQGAVEPVYPRVQNAGEPVYPRAQPAAHPMMQGGPHPAGTGPMSQPGPATATTSTRRGGKLGLVVVALAILAGGVSAYFIATSDDLGAEAGTGSAVAGAAAGGDAGASASPGAGASTGSAAAAGSGAAAGASAGAAAVADAGAVAAAGAVADAGAAAAGGAVAGAAADAGPGAATVAEAGSGAPLEVMGQVDDETNRRPTALITIKIESLPPGAAVIRKSDGVRLGETPYTYQIEPQKGPIAFLLRHKGYRDEIVTVPGNRSSERKVPLIRSSGPDRAPTIHD